MVAWLETAQHSTGQYTLTMNEKRNSLCTGCCVVVVFLLLPPSKVSHATLMNGKYSKHISPYHKAQLYYTIHPGKTLKLGPSEGRVGRSGSGAVVPTQGANYFYWCHAWKCSKWVGRYIMYLDVSTYSWGTLLSLGGQSGVL